MKKQFSFKGKVLADAMRHEELENIGVWLNKAIRFSPELYLSEKHKIKADILFDSLPFKAGYNQEQKHKDFEILLANLFYQTKNPIRISLNHNNWKKSKYNPVSYNNITDLIKTFSENKLMTMNKGYHIEKESRETRIQATKQLLDIFPEYNTGVLSKPCQLVILKDKNGKLKEYKDTAETWRIRTILARINEVNSKVDISYTDYKLHANLVAIFTERFTWYGRLHTRGFRHYQGFSGEERKEILINGDSVIELDYRGLHPNLLYAAEGIQLDKDPYSIIDERPEVRLFLKIILLCMINSENFNLAQKASNNWLFENHEEREQLKAIGITRARPLMDKFYEVHQPIAHYLCTGKENGMKLMNKDSKIALDVINHFAKQNIPILCVHDSFIVQQSYRDALYNVMKSTYQKHTGFCIEIK